VVAARPSGGHLEVHDPTAIDDEVEGRLREAAERAD
jgi:hypothetical protein